MSAADPCVERGLKRGLVVLEVEAAADSTLMRSESVFHNALCDERTTGESAPVSEQWNDCGVLLNE